jgi:hypothetical protein
MIEVGLFPLDGFIPKGLWWASMSVKNWVYGGKFPSPQSVVDDAVYAAHKYRNKQCELELAKRQRHYDILRRFAPEFVEAEKDVQCLESELASCRESIQAEKMKQRTKHPVGCKHWTSRISDIKAELKTARAKQKEAKHSAYDDPKVKAAIIENAEQHKAEFAQAKQESGLYWGTEAIVTQSCRSFSSGAPPRYVRYEGAGQLAVQVQGGMDTKDLTNPNTLVYLEGEGRLRTAKIRIASDDGRQVFADLPIVMHRELPDGRVKWAFLQRRKRANKTRYSLRMSIEVGDGGSSEVLPGEVSIHVGWRMLPDGLKVATWLGSDGKKGELVLPNKHLEDYARLDEIKSTRDREFNDEVDILRKWMADSVIPGWMEEATGHIHSWMSQKRLAALVIQWRDNRFDQDRKIFERLDRWRKKDKHAWQNFARLSERISGRRKTIYQTFLCELSKQYGVAIIASIDAKELNENSDPEDLETDPTIHHRRSKWAAVSTLLQYVQEKWPDRCIDVEGKNMSRQCMHCGHVNEPQGRRIECRECGEIWDIDSNAATVMLAILEAKELKASEAMEKLLKMQEARRKKIAARKHGELAMKTQGGNG